MFNAGTQRGIIQHAAVFDEPDGTACGAGLVETDFPIAFYRGEADAEIQRTGWYHGFQLAVSADLNDVQKQVILRRGRGGNFHPIAAEIILFFRGLAGTFRQFPVAPGGFKFVSGTADNPAFKMLREQCPAEQPPAAVSGWWL